MKIEDIKRVYLIGIGGIGMSALARYFGSLGKQVSGYDRTETPLTRKLVSEGMDVYYEPDPSRVSKEVDLILFTPAISEEHPEMKAARSSGIPVLKRAQALGLISRSCRTIAVAGTHGKTTTSTMIAHLLQQGGISCTAFLGGLSVNFQSNFIAGTSDWMVVEADEYDRSFLELTPEMAVITSVEADHLEIYGDAASVWETGFRAFAEKVNKRGLLVANTSVSERFDHKPAPCALLSYGVEKGTCRAENTTVSDRSFIFDYADDQGTIASVSLSMPGRHNVENAVAAIAIARKVGLTIEEIAKGMASFKGIKRRFEKVWESEDIIFYDDYAHHPTEVSAVIQGLKDLFPEKQITGIFQPHLFSRTRDFATEFARALDQLDVTYLLPIYPAREMPLKGVSSELILEKMGSGNGTLVKETELLEVLTRKKPEVLITMGAGNIDQWIEPIIKSLANGK